MSANDDSLTKGAKSALQIVRDRQTDGSFTFSEDVAALMFEAFYRAGEKAAKTPDQQERAR